MPDAPQGCQLYLISPPDPANDFPERLERALDAGPVAAFQLRMKGADDAAIVAMAERLMPICADHGSAFILNDRADLAAKLGADGVHLGQDDGDVAEARALLGRDAQIGATCHDSRHLAMEAGEAGADYVAFGAFYPSDTKDTTHRPDPDILTWWTTMFVLPCVAIGGITADNAKPLVDAGADFLAVSGAVWNHPEGEAKGVAAFAALLGR
ncbi:thiamine phosphate synthase [Parasphingopyxis sp.]|uniref:thiamine phosphate synthase n=1 Tax=Parasphingopyxis sp. TaxID=1920299 RepID=UPI00262DB6F5|nr:thiamine phosphate synthase [Parasphingopyxis sp.]